MAGIFISCFPIFPPNMSGISALVQENPCLYDVRSNEHKDAIKVANVWASIADMHIAEVITFSYYFSLQNKSASSLCPLHMPPVKKNLSACEIV